MLVDYHVHPDYSIDATGKILDYCKKAIELGLKEICFTTHVDLDPVRKEIDDKVRVDSKIMEMRSEWPEYYLEEIQHARSIFAGKGLKVKAGVEVDYQPHLEEDIGVIINKYDFDFVMGSVHCLEHIAISSSRENAKYFAGKTAEQVLEAYYHVVNLAVESGLFDCIGHLDIYKRYGNKYMNFENPKPLLNEYLSSILNKMKKHRIALELNTSPFRNGGKEPHPGHEVLKICQRMGFNFVTIGSDCHCVKNLAKDVEKAFKIAAKYKLRVYGFEKRIPYVL